MVAQAYTLKDLQAVISLLGKEAADTQELNQKAKDAKASTTDKKMTVRALTAQAICIGYLMSLGRAVVKALIQEQIPETPRKGVNISEIYRVLDNWEDPVELASNWAEGNFSPTVPEALKAIKPEADPLASVQKAVLKALQAEHTPEQISNVVEATVVAFHAAAEASQQIEDSKTQTQEAAQVPA